MLTKTQPQIHTDEHGIEVIIGCAYAVANSLGTGFLEKIYKNAHIAQCLNYLKATGIGTCLLINFGNPKVEIKRLVV